MHMRALPAICIGQSKVTVTLPKLKKSKKTAYAKLLKTKGLKKAKFK